MLAPRNSAATAARRSWDRPPLGEEGGVDESAPTPLSAALARCPRGSATGTASLRGAGLGFGAARAATVEELPLLLLLLLLVLLDSAPFEAACHKTERDKQLQRENNVGGATDLAHSMHKLEQSLPVMQLRDTNWPPSTGCS